MEALMLFYTVVLFLISIFFYSETQQTRKMASRLLPEFNADASTAALAAKHFFTISACSATSGILVLGCWFYQKITHLTCPKPFLAFSMLIYAGGFMLGLYRCYKLKITLNSKQL